MDPISVNTATKCLHESFFTNGVDKVEHFYRDLQADGENLAYYCKPGNDHFEKERLHSRFLASCEEIQLCFTEAEIANACATGCAPFLRI